MKNKLMIIAAVLFWVTSLWAADYTVTTDETLSSSLDEYESDLFYISDGWSNGDMFYCTWREEQVTFADGQMSLELDYDTESSYPPYAGAEYRTNDFYHYGHYKVRMKAAQGSGIVTSFFTYTSEYEDPDSPWDEIDIEILGKDTTQMQTNYFTAGVGGHETIIDLGFDSSQDFHDYAIEWLPDRINWYVDGELVHTEDGSRGELPSHESKIMVNLWPGTGVDSWLGAFDPSILPVTAQYQSISYAPYDESAIDDSDDGGDTDDDSSDDSESPFSVTTSYNDWQTGFVAYFTITNNSSETINGWELSFDWDEEFTVVYNALLVSDHDNHYVIQSPSDYNREIAPGESVQFAVQGAPGGIESDPQNYSVYTEGGSSDDTTDDGSDEVDDGDSSTDSPILEDDFSTDSGDWGLGLYENGNATFSVSEQLAAIDISAGGSQTWSVQLTHGGLVLEEGAEYTVSFRAKAELARTIELNVGQSVSPWGSYSGSRLFTLTQEWETYTFAFIMEGSYESNARIEFNLGTELASVELDDVVIIKE